MNYLILVAAWIVYLGSHSFFAANGVKGFFKKYLSSLHRIYRFLYSVISSLGLMAILGLMATMEAKYLFKSSRIVQYVGMVLAVWGIILVVASFRKLSGKAFLGLTAQMETPLVTDGIHGKVRHPIYSGTILIFVGMFLYVPSDIVLLSIGVIFLYLPAGIYLEEKKLVEEFGAEYLSYKKRVPAIIPGIF